MSISTKILNFLYENKIEKQELAKIMGLKASLFSKKMNGAINITEKDLKKLKDHFPEMDFNKLFSDEEYSSLVCEPRTEYEITGKNSEIKKDLKAIYELCKKHISDTE